MSVALAARAALRVLPIVQQERKNLGARHDFLADIVLPVFRAIGVAWSAAKYPDQATRLSAASAASASASAASASASAASADAADAADAAFASAASAAGADAAFAASASAASASAASADAAFAAASAAARAFTDAAFVRTGIATGTISARAADPFWSAVSFDATQLEDGVPASVIAGSTLWPQGQPDLPQSLWQEMKRDLLAANQDWDVWTEWYEARLRGKRSNKKLEIARSTIPNNTWDQGPAVVNAEIKRLIEKYKPKRPQKETKTAHQPTPPEAPLPSPSPATRFVVQQEVVDVVLPTAWAGREAQFAAYHARARTIALGLADRLANTDAAPEVAGSVNALLDVLGENPTEVQPDQLRLASRTIVAKARTYAHPSAQWELSAESVSTLLELADLLVDLQAFARPELENHERAVRALDLTETMVAEAKESLDLMSEAIAATPEIVSDRALIAINASFKASANAADKTVQLSIEGDRILLTENFALALARYLGSSAIQESALPSPAISGRGVERAELSKSPPRKQPAKTTSRTASSEDFVARIVARLDKKGPDAIADALLSAVTSTIKHSPKTLSGLAALFYANFIGSQVLLATGGAFSLTLAWIAYELWKRKK